MYMEIAKTYWKPVLVALTSLVIMGMGITIHVKNNTIKLQQSDIATLQAQLAVSNQSIVSLQRAVEMQNTQYQSVVDAQVLKQKESEEMMQILNQEKVTLQSQIDDMMSAPETGIECDDIQGLLRTVGE